MNVIPPSYEILDSLDQQSLAVRIEYSGPYGKGERMSLKHTRALLDAALSGEFDEVELETQPILGLRMPKSGGSVPAEILDPRKTWDDPADYDVQATRLRDMFRENYDKKGFADLGIRAAM